MSTMRKEDRTTYKVGIIKEPVDRWIEDGMLDWFYEDKKKNAFAFQVYAFWTRYEEYVKQVEAKKDYDILLTILAEYVMEWSGKDDDSDAINEIKKGNLQDGVDLYFERYHDEFYDTEQVVIQDTPVDYLNPNLC